MVSDNGNEIILSLAGGNDSLTIDVNSSILANGGLRFANGMNWVAADIYALLNEGTPGDDELFAGPAGSELQGFGGNDRLVGDAGVDILDGGAGDDLLEGGGARDIYRFNRGDGHDVIMENGTSIPPVEINLLNSDLPDDPGPIDPVIVPNQIEFGSDVGHDDILLFRDQHTDDLIIFLKSNDRITVQNQFKDTEIIDSISFADGTFWTISDIEARLFYGDLDSILLGSVSNERIDSFGLFPAINAGGGNDDIVYNRGYGALRVEAFNANDPANVSNLNLNFGEGITPDDVVINLDDSGEFVLSLGGGDNITIIEARNLSTISTGLFDSRAASYGTFQIQFANGIIWQETDVYNQGHLEK